MPYMLIISEKPSAAGKIASALADGEVKKVNGRSGVTFYKIERGGEQIVVAPAVGHLYALFEKKSTGMWSYPTFDVQWRPTYTNKHNYWAKKYFDNISSLVEGANKFVSATDYDREGSVISYNILKFICKVGDGKRMKFSTLTKEDLIEAYENASPHLDFPQIEAGLARHNLDWLWGINTSRALTLALRSAGGYETLSTGRVQGPTLKILTEREREIAAFIPVPFWELELTGKYGKGDIVAIHEKGKFWEKKEAEDKLKKSDQKKATVESADKKKYKQVPPVPFDLTTLQRESYRHFKYSPKQTLDYAQVLYEKALISYPRTSSQKLPAKIGYGKILKSLGGWPTYKEICEKLLSKKKLVPNEGKKEDPAHPAIYPTGSKPVGLNEQQRKVYDLIVRRFFAVFGEPATRESLRIVLKSGQEKYNADGVTTLEPGWMEYYDPYAKFKETVLPEAKIGDKIDVKKIDMIDKETQPPKRFSQASILKEMETLNLGTKATRAGILQTLYDRGYIQEKTIEVTELGKSVITALDKHCPEIVSVDMTDSLEKEMESIREGKLKSETVIKKAKEELAKVLQDFKKREKEIGSELIDGVKKHMKEQSAIGKCDCGGTLEIRFSRGGKRFVGCTNYPKCTQTYSMPHTGKIIILKKTCEKCGLNIVSVRQPRKRPWQLCVRCGFVNIIKKSAKAAAKKKAKKK